MCRYVESYTRFDLRTKENEEQFRHRGHFLMGLRYDEKREQLTVFLERCHGLDQVGWLMLRGALHINGFLVKEEKAKSEQITSVNPEIKRRMVFTKIQRTLLGEYTLAVYMAFRRYFSYYKFFGQVNLSAKSKIKDEQAIWAEAVKLPGEAAFKQLAIQPFVGKNQKLQKSKIKTQKNRTRLQFLKFENTSMRNPKKSQKKL